MTPVSRARVDCRSIVYSKTSWRKFCGKVIISKHITYSCNADGMDMGKRRKDGQCHGIGRVSAFEDEGRKRKGEVIVGKREGEKMEGKRAEEGRRWRTEVSL